MRKSSPAQLALIDLPSVSADRDAAEASEPDASSVGPSSAWSRRERQSAINVEQCQALLETIARLPTAGAAVPTARPSGRRVRRSHVEERRIQQLAALYAAFERSQQELPQAAPHGMPGGTPPVPGRAANDERRTRGRGTRVA